MKQQLSISQIYSSLYIKTSHVMEMLIVSISVLLTIISFLILLGITKIAPGKSVCLILIGINLAMVSCLSAIIVYRAYPIIMDWRTGRIASKLHFRIIMLFSAVATIPALIVAIVAAVTFNRGLDRWFNGSTQDIVNSSINIANVYSAETLNSLIYNAHNMRNVLDNSRLLRNNLVAYRRAMALQAVAYDLRGAFLLSPSGKVYVSSHLGGEDKLPIPPKDLIERADDRGTFSFQPGKHDYFGVILKLYDIPNTYLYVVKQVHAGVLQALRLTEYNTNRYKDMQESRVPLQFAFAILYLCLFLTMLLCAVLMGINVANKLVHPIRRLIGAADKVAKGQLNVSVPISSNDDDMAHLSGTFNNMVNELKAQRDELIEKRDFIDERRRFIEAVLSGVSAGIIGVNSLGKITMVNRSIERMFKINKEDLTGITIEDFSKKISSEHLFNIYTLAIWSKRLNYNDQVSIVSAGHMRVYNVQFTGAEGDDIDRSWVITIDDITDLVEAHRSLAWADVARRIAHEIKNPLTPIQLSAERIKRRYSNMITKDRDVFEKCLETIIRQVNDIGRMVNEFSSFARMPKSNVALLDIRSALIEACFLVEVAKSEIKFTRDLSDQPLYGNFDSRLITQVFTNLIKNASESIEAAIVQNKIEQGYICVKAFKNGDQIIIDIIDNGKGWPEIDREKLLEPYITTRELGTGLGLAIVRKIVEEHKGAMELRDAPDDFHGGKGAMVRVIFPFCNN